MSTVVQNIQDILEYFTPEYIRFFKRLKPTSRRTYFTYIASYLRKYGTDFSYKNVDEFLTNLPKSVRAKAFYAIKHFAQFNGYNFEVKSTKEFPEGFFKETWERDVERFSKEELFKFARACVEGKLSWKDASAVALCMIYGLRRSELHKMIPEHDINPKERWLFVRTSKKGMKRKHFIPSEILPFAYYLHKNRVRFHDSFFETQNFIKISKKAGVEYHPNRSWHAFRRSLVTDLLNTGISDVKVFEFMRWSRREIIFKYYMPDPELIDKEIFQVHPYLKWFSKKAIAII